MIHMVYYDEPTTWELIKSRWMLYKDLRKYDGMLTSDVRPEDKNTVLSLMHHKYLMCCFDPKTHEPQLKRTEKRVW